MIITPKEFFVQISRKVILFFVENCFVICSNTMLARYNIFKQIIKQHIYSVSFVVLKIFSMVFEIYSSTHGSSLGLKIYACSRARVTATRKFRIA